jgi:hypothetical protein
VIAVVVTIVVRATVAVVVIVTTVAVEALAVALDTEFAVAVIAAVTVTVVVAVAVTAGVLPDSERDQQDTGDVVHPAELGESEVREREEVHEDDGDTADEVTDPEDRARYGAVEPLVLRIERVARGDRPPVSGSETVDETQRGRPRRESEHAAGHTVSEPKTPIGVVMPESVVR